MRDVVQINFIVDDKGQPPSENITPTKISPLTNDDMKGISLTTEYPFMIPEKKNSPPQYRINHLHPNL